MIKIFCYFILEALFVLEIFKILSWLFGYVQKRFDKKVKVNSKKLYHDIYLSAQINTTHIFPNISRSKDNWVRKFGQLVEYNVLQKQR